MTTSPSAKDRVEGAASTATDEGRHVAGVAKEEAQNVASTAAHQARNLVSQAVSQASDQMGQQTNTQRDRLVGTLRTLGDDLQRMAEQSGGSGLATDLAREVAERARQFGSRLDGREPGELLDEVREFARRRPGVFLLGAMAAGVVAGRLARGAKEGMSSTGPTGEEQMAGTPSVSAAPGTIIDSPADVTPPMPPATPGQPTVGAPPSSMPPTTGTPGYGTPGVQP